MNRRGFFGMLLAAPVAAVAAMKAKPAEGVARALFDGERWREDMKRWELASAEYASACAEVKKREAEVLAAGGDVWSNFP